ncbi:MAG: hypothetical protein ACRBBP_06780, partial [Bdellovibrionales bacterium]
MRIFQFSVYIVLILFNPLAKANLSCSSLLSSTSEVVGLSTKGQISKQEISAYRHDNYEGNLIDGYSSFAKLKAGLLKLEEGQSVVLGSRGRSDDIQDYILARKTNGHIKLLIKRQFFSIEEARNDYYDMLEREQLFATDGFEGIKTPRVIAFEGNELFFEFIEGKNLREELAQMPFNEEQETLFMKYAALIENIKSKLDNSTDRLDGTRQFQAWEYEEARIKEEIDFLDMPTGKKVAEGSLLLLDVNRVGRKYSSYSEEGFLVLSLRPSALI